MLVVKIEIDMYNICNLIDFIIGINFEVIFKGLIF